MPQHGSIEVIVNCPLYCRSCFFPFVILIFKKKTLFTHLSICTDLHACIFSNTKTPPYEHLLNKHHSTYCIHTHIYTYVHLYTRQTKLTSLFYYFIFTILQWWEKLCSISTNTCIWFPLHVSSLNTGDGDVWTAWQPYWALWRWLPSFFLHHLSR